MKSWLVCLLPLVTMACSSSTPEPVSAPRVALRSKPAARVTAAPRPKIGLKQSDISPVVMARYGDVTGCHAVGYSGDRDAEGSLVVGWVIQPDGTVSSPQVLESSFNDDVERCVLQVTKDLKFPEASDFTEVSWRFKFRAR